MSSTFRIETDSAKAKAKVLGIKKGLTLTSIDETVRKVAFVTHRRLVSRTPKKWTGHTRKSWRVFRRGNSKYSVTNLSKVMIFLEDGTRSHGAKNGGRLFIPITRKAALAGARKVFQSNNQSSGDTKPFIAGRDFVLAKRVRGIRAHRIVADSRPFARITLKSAMRLKVRKIIES